MRRLSLEAKIESAGILYSTHPLRWTPPTRYEIWYDAVYSDCALPFGLRSAPKLFNAIADALQLIAQK